MAERHKIEFTLPNTASIEEVLTQAFLGSGGGDLVITVADRAHQPIYELTAEGETTRLLVLIDLLRERGYFTSSAEAEDAYRAMQYQAGKPRRWHVVTKAKAKVDVRFTYEVEAESREGAMETVWKTGKQVDFELLSLPPPGPSNEHSFEAVTLVEEP